VPAKRKLIGQVLLEKKLITQEQLEAALARKERWGKRLGENLVSLGYLSEKQLTKVLGEIYRIPTVDIDTAPITINALRLIPGEFCRKHHLIPITVKAVEGRDHLIVAVSDPSNVEATDELRFLVKYPIFEVLSTISGIDEAIRKHFRSHGAPYIEERNEVTLARQKDETSMEIIHDGTIDRVKVHEVKEVAQPPPQGEPWERAFHSLVKVLVNKQIISEEEGNRLLSM
jgi:hypothetical protein